MIGHELIAGARYRVAFRMPRTDLVVVERGTYLGRAEGLIADEMNAFRFDDSDHVCVLISDGALVHADLIDELHEVKTQRAAAATAALNGGPATAHRI